MCDLFVFFLLYPILFEALIIVLPFVGRSKPQSVFFFCLHVSLLVDPMFGSMAIGSELGGSRVVVFELAVLRACVPLVPAVMSGRAKL